MRSSNRGQEAGLPGEVLEFLKNWLYHHIMELDRDFGAYLNAHPDALRPEKRLAARAHPLSIELKTGFRFLFFRASHRKTASHPRVKPGRARGHAFPEALQSKLARKRGARSALSHSHGPAWQSLYKNPDAILQPLGGDAIRGITDGAATNPRYTKKTERGCRRARRGLTGKKGTFAPCRRPAGIKPSQGTTRASHVAHAAGFPLHRTPPIAGRRSPRR